ncbi:MAG: ABC transporter substrate-binding protein [Deltaproteobacteria bacterium]|nr:ABC transporter substrate-binding protein [Deltaproteobacteria bacterium]
MLLLALGAASARAEIVVRDDTGREVRLADPASRIVPLHGGLAEILLALGAGDRIVARTDADQDVPGLADLPSIGTHMRPGVERVVHLRPDLVVQMDGRDEARESVQALESLGLTVAVFRAADMDGLMRTLDRLGTLTGTQARACDLADSWQARLKAVEIRVADRPPVPLVFEVRYPNLLVAGDQGMTADIIRRAGGRNLVTEPAKLVRLGEETLVALAPEAYVTLTGPMNPCPIRLPDRPHFRTLPAVRHNRVLNVDQLACVRPGPRNIEAVEELAAFLHPSISTGEARP